MSAVAPCCRRRLTASPRCCPRKAVRMPRWRSPRARRSRPRPGPSPAAPAKAKGMSAFRTHPPTTTTLGLCALDELSRDGSRTLVLWSWESSVRANRAVPPGPKAVDRSAAPTGQHRARRPHRKSVGVAAEGSERSGGRRSTTADAAGKLWARLCARGPARRRSHFRRMHRSRRRRVQTVR